MTDKNQAALAALEKLAKLMPVRPKAITYDLGTDILNCVQDDLEQHFGTLRAALQSLTAPSAGVDVSALVHNANNVKNWASQQNPTLAATLICPTIDGLIRAITSIPDMREAPDVKDGDFIEMVAKAHCEKTCPTMDWSRMSRKQKHQHIQPVHWWLQIIKGLGFRIKAAPEGVQ